MTAAELKEWRQRRGWSREKAARMIGYSYSRYCKLESSSNKNNISLTIELACKYYDLAAALVHN